MFSNRVAAWLDRRIPPSRSVRLNRHSVFIFLTPEGLLFSVLLLVLLLTAINYQNSMIYLFTFFLISLLHVVIYHSYQNLSGLRVGFRHAEPVTAGNLCYFDLVLSSDKHQGKHYSISLQVPGNEEEVVGLVDSEAPPVTVSLPVNAERRGILRLGRIRVESRYPLGLLRTWSWLDLDCETIVYPAPVQLVPVRHEAEQGDNELLGARSGVVDFKGVKPYVAGDPVNRIDWKNYAKRGEMSVKEFEAPASSTRYFSISDYPGRDIETVLSALCFDVMQASESGQPFGLDLKTFRAEPATGESHTRACLEALARYGVPQNPRADATGGTL